MNTTTKTEDLLADYYHYKALYDLLTEEENQESQQIELILRLIIIELRNRYIIL